MKRNVVFFLIIFVISFCLVCGCVNQSHSAVPPKKQFPFICYGGQNCNKQTVSVISKDNLSDAQKKLSTDLLLLTGNFDFPTGTNRDALELQMKQDHQLMWIDDTGTTSENKTDNAVVYVYIKTREKVDDGLLDSYIWNITDADPSNQLVVAWVNVTNLTTLASIDSVLSIQTVVFPETRFLK